MPTLADAGGGTYHQANDYPVTETILGVPHFFIQGIDVTYLRGKSTLIREWTLVEPGGEDSASVEFPQVFGMDPRGVEGDELDFFGFDRTMEIVIIEEGATPGVFDGFVHSVWCGLIAADQTHMTEDATTTELQGVGLLIGPAMAQQHRPLNYMESTDIGTVIPDVLNALTSRKFDPIAYVTTGIMTRELGAETDKVWDYVQDLLSTAWTEDAQQWTIRRAGAGEYEMVLKDNTTVDYQVEAGTPGISSELSAEHTQKITTIWGRGVGPDGYSWRGNVFPDFLLGEYDEDALDGRFRFPLITWGPVDDGSLNPTGEPHPDYDPGVERYDREINFPRGLTKAQAYSDAERILDREIQNFAAGPMTLRSDLAIPDAEVGPANSRFLMQAGANITYANYYPRSDFLFRCSQVRVDLQRLEVELLVDSRQRDVMTLSQIYERNRFASEDPARRPGNVNRVSRQERDVVFEYDGEATGGIIPDHEVTGGAWFIFPRPLSGAGRIVRLSYWCESRFALALFGAPITPSELAALVPDPLASEDPFAAESEALNDAGIIEGWGRQGDACGYHPGQESAGDPFTGFLLDTNTIEYNSARQPWVWVCEWVESTATMSGQIYPDVTK
jgi:hypothetical protein